MKDPIIAEYVIAAVAEIALLLTKDEAQMAAQMEQHPTYYHGTMIDAARERAAAHKKLAEVVALWDASRK